MLNKRNLLEWGFMLSVGAIIYFAGWHTELIGRVQQGLLYSGILRPDVEAVSGAEEDSDDFPPADFGFQLRDGTGKVLGMEELRGKVIFLNLWATWCPPCIAEMPGIDDLAKEMAGENIVFLMVSVDKDFGKAVAFRDRKEFSFEVYSPEGGMPDMFQSRSIPATWVISAGGKLVLTQKGMADYDTEEFREFLLNQR